MVVVFKEPVRRRYTASICSVALLLQLLCIAALIAGPLYAAFDSGGFLLHEATFSEQPRVHYRHELLVQLDTKSDAGVATTLFWSTFSALNSANQAVLRAPVVKVSFEHS